MFKIKKKLKDLDRNELIIKWGDEIIFHANHLGEVSRDSFDPSIFFSDSSGIPREVLEIRNHVITSLGDTKGDVNIIVKELISYLEGVKNHLLSNEYIKDPIVTERFWRIDDEGKLMKKFGGHNQYKAYKKKKLDAEISDQNSKIYWWWRDWHKAIVGIVVGGIGGLFAEHQFDIVNTILKSVSPKRSIEQQTNQKTNVSKATTDSGNSKTIQYSNPTISTKQVDTLK